MRTVVVLEEAAEDIEQARDFYESINTGVGDYCVDSLLNDIESLREFHGIHAKHLGFHRALSNRFPFGLYYRETATRTEVFAILDLRKDPSWIRAEIENRSV
jgi:plasmid stabilization system protein ParE